MAAVLQTEHHSKVLRRAKSRLKFVVPFNDSFTVLPDATTVIGVNPSDLRYLQAENLGTRESNREQFNTKNLSVSTIAFNQSQSLLLAADDKGNLMAFRIGPDNLSSTRLLLELGPNAKRLQHHVQLKGQRVFACDQLDGLTVLAGAGVVVLDTATGRVVGRRLEDTAIAQIMSVSLCRVSEKTLLVLAGHGPHYSGAKTDVFDITRLAESCRTGSQAGLGRETGSAGTGKSAVKPSDAAKGGNGFGHNLYGKSTSRNFDITNPSNAKTTRNSCQCKFDSNRLAEVFMTKMEHLITELVNGLGRGGESPRVLPQNRASERRRPGPKDSHFGKKLRRIIRKYKHANFFMSDSRCGEQDDTREGLIANSDDSDRGLFRSRIHPPNGQFAGRDSADDSESNWLEPDTAKRRQRLFDRRLNRARQRAGRGWKQRKRRLGDGAFSGLSDGALYSITAALTAGTQTDSRRRSSLCANASWKTSLRMRRLSLNPAFRLEQQSLDHSTGCRLKCSECRARSNL